MPEHFESGTTPTRADLPDDDTLVAEDHPHEGQNRVDSRWAQLADTPQVREWFDLGFDVADAADWAELGIAPADARVWVELGVSPDDVREWAESGFGLGDARGWVGLGVTSEDATEWVRRGFSLSEARAWVESGVPPEDARDWIGLGLGPSEAFEWASEGFGPRPSYRFLSVYGDASAGEWLSLGLGPADAGCLRRNGYWPEDVALLRGLGLPSGVSDLLSWPVDLQGWVHAGFEAEEAREWNALELSSDEAVLLRSFGLKPEEVEEWWDEEFGVEEITAWASAAPQLGLPVSVGFAARWRPLAPSEIPLAIDLGYESGSTAAPWLRHRVDRVAAEGLRDLGVAPDRYDATRWCALVAVGLEHTEVPEWADIEAAPEEIAVWRGQGFSGDAARVWRGHSFDPVAAKRWQRGGFSAPEAAEWTGRSFNLKAAKEWKSFGFDARTAAAWAAESISPATAARRHAAGLVPPSPNSAD